MPGLDVLDQPGFHQQGVDLAVGGQEVDVGDLADPVADPAVLARPSCGSTTRPGRGGSSPCRRRSPGPGRPSSGRRPGWSGTCGPSRRGSSPRAGQGRAVRLPKTSCRDSSVSDAMRPRGVPPAVVESHPGGRGGRPRMLAAGVSLPVLGERHLDELFDVRGHPVKPLLRFGLGGGEVLGPVDRRCGRRGRT